MSPKCLFQHTAARRRLAIQDLTARINIVSTHSRPKAAGLQKMWGGDLSTVSTHSRPKAAGGMGVAQAIKQVVSTHSRPKAAGSFLTDNYNAVRVSTHSRPKAAGFRRPCVTKCLTLFQHTAARRRLEIVELRKIYTSLFQHTAARRRLALPKPPPNKPSKVSTHSRPKAAGRHRSHSTVRQPLFQHTAARRRLVHY